jgi:hypothetical protein
MHTVTKKVVVWRIACVSCRFIVERSGSRNIRLDRLGTNSLIQLGRKDKSESRFQATITMNTQQYDMACNKVKQNARYG